MTLVDEDTEKKAVWQIVGEVEADAKKGRISILAAGRALIGKKQGATVEVMAPGGCGPMRSPRSSGDRPALSRPKKAASCTRLFVA